MAISTCIKAIIVLGWGSLRYKYYGLVKHDDPAAAPSSLFLLEPVKSLIRNGVISATLIDV